MNVENDKSKFLKQLIVHRDERGFLFELLRNDNVNFSQFGQVYIIGDNKKGVVRAWHRHFKMDEWFCCIQGKALFVLYDPETKTFKEYDMPAGNPALLFVPRLHFHGHQALKENSIIIAICSEPYYKNKVDEERVAFDYFPEYRWRDDIK